MALFNHMTMEESAMSLQERIDALKEKHHALDTELEQENARPHPDDAHVAELKKQKLAIKDEIASLGGP